MMITINETERLILDATVEKPYDFEEIVHNYFFPWEMWEFLLQDCSKPFTDAEHYDFINAHFNDDCNMDHNRIESIIRFFSDLSFYQNIKDDEETYYYLSKDLCHFQAHTVGHRLDSTSEDLLFNIDYLAEHREWRISDIIVMGDADIDYSSFAHQPDFRVEDYSLLGKKVKKEMPEDNEVIQVVAPSYEVKTREWSKIKW